MFHRCLQTAGHNALLLFVHLTLQIMEEQIMAAFRELRATLAAVGKAGCWVPAGLKLLGAAQQTVGRGSTCTCRCVQHM